jgi:hypothetical protein
MMDLIFVALGIAVIAYPLLLLPATAVETYPFFNWA